MARFFAGIHTEREREVTRLGHKEIETFLQTNDFRVTVDAYVTEEKQDIFRVFFTAGRYRNMFERSGKFCEVKNGKIYIGKDFRDKIIFIE